MRRKWLLWCGLAIVLIGALSLYLYWLAKTDACKIPSVGDIEAMRAIIYERGPMDLRFSVPREKWAEILDALTPAEVDKAPAEWQTIGTLVVTEYGGRSVIIELFSLRDQPGAFRIEAIGKQVYYRGGDSANLESALRAAYEASRER